LANAVGSAFALSPFTVTVLVACSFFILCHFIQFNNANKMLCEGSKNDKKSSVISYGAFLLSVF
jgi:hypothetical protein